MPLSDPFPLPVADLEVSGDAEVSEDDVSSFVGDLRDASSTSSSSCLASFCDHLVNLSASVLNCLSEARAGLSLRCGVASTKSPNAAAKSVLGNLRQRIASLGAPPADLTERGALRELLRSDSTITLSQDARVRPYDEKCSTS